MISPRERSLAIRNGQPAPVAAAGHSGAAEGRTARNPWSGRSTLAASIILAGLSAASMPSCNGRVAGDERSFWIPATTITVTGKEGAEGDGTVASGAAYAGMEEKKVYGVTSYYTAISDIPGEVSGREERLVRLLLSRLSHSYDFTYPPAASMLGNDVFVFMTDPAAWPSAIYSKDMARALRMQVLGTDGSTISDCLAGPCVFTDVIAINNRTSFYPQADTVDALAPGELDRLDSLAGVVSEEVLHDYWMDGLDEQSRARFASSFREIWDSGSSGEEDDAVLAGAWKSGFVPFALKEDGTIGQYSLRNYVLGAIAAYCTGCDAGSVRMMEVAAISYLQLIGDQADTFMGQPPNTYLEYYRRMDAQDGKPPGGYEYYLDKFIARESFPHLGRANREPVPRRYAPAFMRQSFEPFCRKAHLDGVFTDGSTAQGISQNPYLADKESFLSIIRAIVPPSIAAAKGQ